MRTALPGSRRDSLDDRVRQRMDTLFGPARPHPLVHPADPAPPECSAPRVAAATSPPRPEPPAERSLTPEPFPLLSPPLPASPHQRPHRPSLSERLRSLLPLAVQERMDLDRRALVGLCVLLVLALGYGVQHFWAGRPVPVAVPAAEASGTASGVATGTGESAVAQGPTTRVTGQGGVPAGTPTGAGVVVDVAGRVRAPGVRTLRPGSRVQDALRAAGGALAGTDLTGLNLARIVNDGEEIVVGAPAAAAPAPGTAGGSPLSLNTATAEQLDALPGLGPVLAQRIIQFRDQHGGFRSVDQLSQITGFGQRRLKDLRPLVRP
jgi:competence protein ComEA